MDEPIDTRAEPRVVLGVGAAARLVTELELVGARRALLVTSPGRRETAEALGADLGERLAGHFPGAAPHVPIETVRAACAEASRVGADAVVTVGGGTTTGLGKAIALETGLLLVALPTTLSGSEMTPAWSIREGRRLRSGRDARALPRTVLYDPVLTSTLPPATLAASGMNALAHALEALHLPGGEGARQLAGEGLHGLLAALPVAVAAPADLAARAGCLQGASNSARAIAHCTLGLHHRLCHLLVAAFDLPHAATHAALLPHTTAAVSAAVPDAMARVGAALGSASVPSGLRALALRLGAPTSLRALGLPDAALERAASLAAASRHPGPRPLDGAGLRALLGRAFEGAPPVE